MADNFDAIKQMHKNQTDNEEIISEEPKIKNKKKNIFRNLKEKIKFPKISFECFKKFYNKNVLLSLILIIIICFCQYSTFNHKYELVFRDGQTYRLNKVNGKIALLQNTRLISISEPKNSDEAMINKTNVWDPNHISQLDNIDINLMTKWMDDKLYYQISVSPYTKRLKNIKNNPFDNMYKSFTIKFQDELGFDLLKITIPIVSMTGNTGNSGKIEALSKNDNIECTFDIFKNIKGWDIEWNF